MKSNGSLQSHKKNRHGVWSCLACGQEKRSDTIDKKTGKCRKCSAVESSIFKQPKAGARSVVAPLQATMLGKRSRETAPRQQVLSKAAIYVLNEDFQRSSTISDEIEDGGNVDIAQETFENHGKRARCDPSGGGDPCQGKVPLQQGYSYAIPAVQIHEIVINQRQTDFDAVAILENIEVADSMDDFQKQFQLMRILHLISQPLVSTFLQSRAHPVLSSVVISLIQKTEALNQDQLNGLAWACVMLKHSSTFASLSIFFAKVADEHLQFVLRRFQLSLNSVYGLKIAAWVVENWKYLDDQTFGVLDHLSTAHSVYDAEILSLSLAVDTSSSLLFFISCCEALLPFTFGAAIVLESIQTFRKQGKMSYHHFTEVVSELMKTQNKQLLTTNRGLILTFPLTEWVKQIKFLQSTVLIDDVASIQEQLDALKGRYGSQQFDQNLFLRIPVAAKVIDKLDPRPNNLQIALAQFAAGMVSAQQLVLLQFAAGQGKSFVEKLTAYFLLATQVTQRVHLVYSNDHLLARDRAAFQQLQVLGDLAEGAICFQVGLAFERDPTDVLIVDEADSLLFRDPVAFRTDVGSSHCLCLTATPDDADARGLERNVIELLGFKKIAPVLANNGSIITAAAKPDSLINRTLESSTFEDLYSQVVAELKTKSVLLYCTEEMRQFIEENKGQPFILVDESVSDTVIGALDECRLLVATDSHLMRGLDFRAEKNGITLIIAKPFVNVREAIQGLYRVGRYGDPCTRILACRALVDPVLETTYFGRLVQFIKDNSKQFKGKVVKPLAAKACSSSAAMAGGKSSQNSKQLLYQPSTGRSSVYNLIRQQQEQQAKKEQEGQLNMSQ